MLRHHAGKRGREGFALVMALGALLVIGTLVAGTSYLVIQETRLGRTQLVQTRAFAAAEYGLNKIQADWDLTPNLQMAVGATFDTSYIVPNQGTARVRYTRLNDETFWITSEGRVGEGSGLGAASTALKRVNAVLRLRIPTIGASGAFTTSGAVRVTGSALVTGANTHPPGWTGCDATAVNKAGIVAPPGADVFIQHQAQVQGNPPVLRDALVADSTTYVRYGDENWNSLKSQASITITTGTTPQMLEPTVLNGRCNKTISNWGEPNRGNGSVPECYNYFPIIYSRGDLAISSGRGQGILLVEGDLRINGIFTWSGLIVVRDDVEKGNGTATVFGAVMARNATVDDASAVLGNTTYRYSQCGLARALAGSAQVVQARQRAWAELF